MTDENVAAEVKSESSGPRKSVWKRFSKPAIGLAVLVVVILWSVGVFQTRTPPGQLKHEPGQPVPAAAVQFTVKMESVSPRVDVVGTVESDSKVHLSARIPAAVKEVLVSAGSQVRKDQTLATLDDREIREQVAAAEAQFKQAETECNRARQLFENKATTEQALTAAQSALTAARAQWERSKVMLTYTQITSPIDGIVTDRRIEPGDLAGPGQVLFAVYDPARMQLQAPVPVRLLGQLPVGRQVEVTLDRYPTNFLGTVRQIVSEIDPLSRTRLVKVSIAGAGGEVLPGTFGRLWVPDDARDAIMIPASAVYVVGQVELVQLVKDGRALRHAVRTGPRHGPMVEVLSGLDAGDVVLVNPVAKED